MPRELVTIQIGQCGNQIGWRFWDLAVREHAAASPDGVFDEAMSTFFRNVDERYSVARDVESTIDSTGAAVSKVASLRARAVLVDMEEGVVSQVVSGPLRDLFDDSQVITDVSGSGNNWAHGYCEYGPKYRDDILDRVRMSLEVCDSPQSFFFLHSMGGGTGSGLGTYSLAQIHDEFPDMYRFVSPVFPSEEDDVVTSPYNSALAIAQLNEHADCVLPVENSALAAIVAQATKLAEARGGSRAGGGARASATPDRSGSSTAFDSMNELAARMLTGLTAGMRFSGPLNVDLNEITTNLVPFSGMHYLVPSLSPAVTMAAAGILRSRRSALPGKPLRAASSAAAAAASGRAGPGRLLPGEPRSADALFSDALLRSNALLGADSARHTYLACGLLARGDVLISDVQRNIERMRASMRMAWFNTDGFKTGICSQPPLDATRSVLALSNNCGIAQTFRRMETSFMRLYKVRAHLHHYTDIMGEAEGGVGLLAGAQEALATLIEDYEHMDGSDTPPEDWAGQGDAALLAAIGIGPTAAEAPATAGAAAAASSAGGRVA